MSVDYFPGGRVAVYCDHCDCGHTAPDIDAPGRSDEPVVFDSLTDAVEYLTRVVGWAFDLGRARFKCRECVGEQVCEDLGSHDYPQLWTVKTWYPGFSTRDRVCRRCGHGNLEVIR